MGLIIAHGKGQWGRSKKNKRVDDELETEINNSPITDTKKVFNEAHIAESLSEKVNIGEVTIKKIDEEDTTKLLNHDKTITPETNNKDKYSNKNDNVMFIEDIESWEEKLRLLNS